MNSFLARCGTLIRFILAGFDRLRLRGEPQQLNNARGVDSYLDRQRVRHVDFLAHAQDLTNQLCAGTEPYARAAGIPLQHRNSPSLDQEAAASALAQRHGRTSGQLASVTAVEGCTSYRLRKDARGWVKPTKEFGKCLHYYHYFDHAELGAGYVRVQSWFPFSIRVGLNGRRWLYRPLTRHGVAFAHRDNLLTAVADPALAQELLDAQCRTDWPAVLTALVEPLQPLCPAGPRSGRRPTNACWRAWRAWRCPRRWRNCCSRWAAPWRRWAGDGRGP